MDNDLKLDNLLSKFKSRMHITHSSEDEYLSDLIVRSFLSISAITHDLDATSPETQELILERARYAYNDQLEFFNSNFQDALLSRALQNYKPNLPQEGENDG
ncbi:phage gp6-like head-tail connector protein [Lacticaseibacillus saniviri]